MEDVTLTFDPTAFQKGLDAINNGLDTMNKNFGNFSKEGTKKVQKVGLSAMNLVKSLAPIGVAFLGIRKAIRQIPELGRTFSIAADIMTKQLLWPLRRELLPLLQKFLDWVRDNRSMFLRWGNAIANVFKIIKSIISGVWDFIKKFWETLSGHLETIFGRTINSVSEMVNLILFKIAVVVEFIRAMFSPLAEFFGNVMGTIVKSVKTFVSSFVEGLGDLGPELEMIVGWLKDLATWLFRAFKNTNLLTGAFKALGGLIGTVVGTVIRGLVEVIDSLVTNLQKIPLAIDMLRGFMKGGAEGILELQRARSKMEKLEEELLQRSKDRSKRTIDAWKKYGKDLMGTDVRSTNIKNITNNNEGSTNTKDITSNYVRSTNIKKVTSNKETSMNNNITNNIDIKVDGTKDPTATGLAVNNSIREMLKEQQFRTGSR